MLLSVGVPEVMAGTTVVLDVVPGTCGTDDSAVDELARGPISRSFSVDVVVCRFK